MKTIKLIFGLLIVCISTESFAAVTEPVAENNIISKARISEIIADQIVFPESMKTFIQDGFVVVKISVDASDQLVVETVSASDKLLQQYVENQLKKVVILNASKSNTKELNMKFVFRNPQ